MLKWDGNWLYREGGLMEQEDWECAGEGVLCLDQ